MDCIEYIYEPYNLVSDEESEAENVDTLAIIVSGIGSIQNKCVVKRKARTCYIRLDMVAYMHQHLNDPYFDKTIRTNRTSFDRLVTMLTPSLLVDEEMARRRGGNITPTMCLYLTLRYLAGGSHHDIMNHLGISMASFYRCLTKTKLAICNCAELDIVFPSSQRELELISNGFEQVTLKQSLPNVVGAVDGYLLSINTPSRSEVGNVKSYFSGHYQKYGLNVQAVCDSSCMFLYFAVSGQGSSNDRVAIHHKLDGISLSDRIEALPGNFVVVADAAYKPTEHVVPIFYGTQRKFADNDNFNFVASQCRIRIEMAFGILQSKWRILRRPLEVSVRRARIIANTIARLHNFVIKEQHNCVYNEIRAANEVDRFDQTTPNVHDDPQFPIPPASNLSLYVNMAQSTSIIRDAMVQRIKRFGATRPSQNMVANNNE